jgi:hypothetical protein
MAAIVGWRGTIIGDLGFADSVSALRHSGRAFHSALWQAKDLNARGQMVADLARGHRLTGVKSSAITSLLGPSECYVNYDDEPCYEIAFDGANHRLEFSVNHSEYGQLTASLGTEAFAGSFGRNSTVAVYSPDVGQLTIEGNRWTHGWAEVVRLTMVCLSAPDTGTYRISTDFYTPISAGVFRTRIRRWLPRKWRTTNYAFVSDSTNPGILRLDTLDLKSGAISGSFQVKMRTIERKPVDTMAVKGTFAGRVVRVSHMPRTRPIRFAPDMGRDCEGARTRE